MLIVVKLVVCLTLCQLIVNVHSVNMSGSAESLCAINAHLKIICR